MQGCSSRQGALLFAGSQETSLFVLFFGEPQHTFFQVDSWVDRAGPCSLLRRSDQVQGLQATAVPARWCIHRFLMYLYQAALGVDASGVDSAVAIFQWTSPLILFHDRSHMARQRRVDVFLSYARKDGSKLARRLHRDLNQKGCNVWMDTRQIAGGASWTREIEEGLDAAEVLLAVLTPGSYISEICRAEQLRALRKGKRVIPLLAASRSDVPLHLEIRNYRDFSGANSYDEQFRQLLLDIRQRRKSVHLKKEYQRTYVAAPPLPNTFVQRAEALRGVREALITDGSGPSIALTALRGMGGVGKTLLAQAVCHDEVVQQAFPDGIAWVTIGKEPVRDLVTLLREVGKALSDDIALYDTETGSIGRYRAAMREKAALIVVDDVWRADDVEPFRAESPRSRLLFTTRDSSIAAALGAQECVAGLMSETQSRDVLSRWSGLKVEDLPAEADDLIKECGCLPLALSMIGAMVRGKSRPYWSRVLDLLRNADLARIKAQFPKYPHTDLLRALQVSVEALDSESRNRYLTLAVLLEDMPVPPPIQQVLWDTDEYGALETAEQFIGRSLAQRDGDEGGIRLHDLQLDYVRAQHPDRESLQLICGAVRLSSLVIEKDPREFVSQIFGRLVDHSRPALREFAERLAQKATGTWLRPLHAALDPPGTALLRTIRGHSAGVKAVAIAADGRRAVSAGEDYRVKVWDLETGREVVEFTGHRGMVNCIALSPDGQRVVSGADTLKVWELETGHELVVPSGHTERVTDVAIGPGGHWAVSASADGTLRVWDLESGRLHQALQGQKLGAERVTLFPDARRLLTFGLGGTLEVVDLKTGRTLATIPTDPTVIPVAALTPDGRLAIFGSNEGALRIWDLETGQEVRALHSHSSYITAVAVSPDGLRVLSASIDATLREWDIATGRELRSLYCNFPVEDLSVTANWRRAIAGSSDGTVRLWDLENPHCLPKPTGHDGYVSCVAVTARGKLAVSGSWDETLRIWDVSTGRQLYSIATGSMVESVAISDDGRQVFAYCVDFTVKVWDVDIGSVARTLLPQIHGVSLRPNGRQALGVTVESALKVWDVAAGCEVSTVDEHISHLGGTAVSADGRRAVIELANDAVTVWDLERGCKLHTLAVPSTLAHVVAISADGRRLVCSGNDDVDVELWDVEAGRRLHSTLRRGETPHALAVDAHGRHAIATYHDHKAVVWDLGTWATVATFTLDASASACAFTGDGTLMVGGSSGRVHFFSLEPGKKRSPA